MKPNTPSSDWDLGQWMVFAGLKPNDNKELIRCANVAGAFEPDNMPSSSLLNDWRKRGIPGTRGDKASPVAMALCQASLENQQQAFTKPLLRDHLRVFMQSKALRSPFEPTPQELDKWTSDFAKLLTADTRPIPIPPKPVSNSYPSLRNLMGVSVGLVLLVVVGLGLFSYTQIPINDPLEWWSGLPQEQRENERWPITERNIDGVQMMLVPAGCFTMGSMTGREREQPTHVQCIEKPFWIDKTEVTNGQFDALMKTTIDPVCNQSSGNSNVAVNPPNADYPRACVFWSDAKTFCEKQSKRLPTEREWEYAARGPSSWQYPYGNEFDQARCRVIVGADAPSKPDAVGKILLGASWVGALDMCGGVWEWTTSIRMPYPYNADDGRESTENIPGDDSVVTWRILRGGSWDNDFTFATTSFRGLSEFDQTFNTFGFRCIKDYAEGDLTRYRSR